MPNHLIFEGAELSGKSWLMSQIYNYLEPKGNKSGYALDGCHWFNADNGVFGTENSRGVIDGYMKIFEVLKKKNIIVEKFTLADEIYQKLHRNKNYDYSWVNKKLDKLAFKIILITLPEDKKIIKARIQDRLKLYPHYKEILQKVDWYINQQRMYKERVKKCGLPYLVVETKVLPEQKLVDDIINWIEFA